jgi:hypothetical protein
LESKINKMNGLAFECDIQETEKVTKSIFKSIDDKFFCECCSLPTLSEKINNESCPVCDWVDLPLNEANSFHGYTLSEAKDNFKNSYSIFKPKDGDLYEKSSVVRNKNGEVVCDLLHVKKILLMIYNDIINESNADKRFELFEDAAKYQGLLKL